MVHFAACPLAQVPHEAPPGLPDLHHQYRTSLASLPACHKIDMVFRLKDDW